jgi:UDP-glucose-4-epimerase GalE
MIDFGVKVEPVLVTGGAGYIGSHVCKALRQANYLPVTFDNLCNGHKEFVKWGPLHVGDLKNISDIESVFSEYRFNTVIHLGALSYVQESVEDPLLYYANNIQGTANLLKVATENSVKDFIFSSSCAVYGDANTHQIDENHPQNPVNPYGFTKLAAEKLIVSLAGKSEFNYVILRYFNVAGSENDLQIGESHLNETHLIPKLIESGMSGKVFNVYGKSFKTPDGTAIRDFLHVVDVASAHLAALKFLRNRSGNLICNIGTGKGFSILEVLSLAKKFFPKLQVNFEVPRPGDPARLVAKPDLARSELSWKAQESSLENILVSAIKWAEVRALKVRSKI